MKALTLGKHQPGLSRTTLVALSRRLSFGRAVPDFNKGSPWRRRRTSRAGLATSVQAQGLLPLKDRNCRDPKASPWDRSVPGGIPDG